MLQANDISCVTELYCQCDQILAESPAAKIRTYWAEALT